MRVLGINAVFHDPAAALVVDGEIVAAAEEERFTRRKHGKPSVPFSTWELPEAAALWCLRHAGIEAADLDAVAYSYDPDLAPAVDGDVTADGWEALRTLYVRRAPRFLATALPGLAPDRVRFVPHHVAHAASAFLCAGVAPCAVLVADGRGERASHLAGLWDGERFTVLASQALPHSLGLLYEELTEHLGFHRSSDEYKVMALASYGQPSLLEQLRREMRVDGASFATDPIAWDRFAPPARHGRWSEAHADLAASVQRRLEEILIALATDLHAATRADTLALAGGVALNCVANTAIWRQTPFRTVWAQPASGDAGTALGAALYTAHALGDRPSPMATAALGRGYDDEEIERLLRAARVPFRRPDDLAAATAGVLAQNGIVAWFQGRSEFGPRALGHRSLLASPERAANLERLNDVKGREQFRPVAPMVPVGRAHEIFDGPVPSPYMLFIHRVREPWRERIPAVVHVDGTARIQTVDRAIEPLVADLLDAFAERTGVPVLVNTSLNTAGRPMVDSPSDALELFGSAPVDAMAIGPFLLERAA